MTRGPKLRISPKMILFIVGGIADAMLSIRQQKKVLENLDKALPIFSAQENRKMPSSHPIYKVITGFPLINTHQIF